MRFVELTTVKNNTVIVVNTAQIVTMERVYGALGYSIEYDGSFTSIYLDGGAYINVTERVEDILRLIEGTPSTLSGRGAKEHA